METLGLELQKDANPLVPRRKMDQQRSVLPYSIASLKAPNTALIHVDVVNATARAEPKVFVGGARFWPPGLAEDVQQAILRLNGSLNVEVNQLLQVIARARHVWGQRLHIFGAK
jgi:hypothetical protein